MRSKMNKTVRTLDGDKLKVFGFVLISIGLLFLSACTTLEVALKKVEKLLWQEKISEPLQLQSDDYVIYRLHDGDTPVTLAEKFLGDEKRSWIIEDANEGIEFRKNQVIIIPLNEENKGGLATDGYQTVPILSYHHFAENCKSHLCISTSVFDQQMRYLKNEGYRVITMRELLGFMRYRHAIPKKSIVITIDDGYRSAYDIAYPVLKKYGFTAALFIYTDYVGVSKSAITWDQLREMKTNGFEIGSHTVSHCDLTKKMAGESYPDYIERIKREIVDSKQIIDKELEQDTLCFAYPYSRYNASVLNLCEQAGYKIGVTVDRGGNAFFKDPLILDRNQILKSDMVAFIANLKTFNPFSLK
jgi:peptidoglycan/xylan/chitin deacetylase (PgdA/CDA1 family)